MGHLSQEEIKRELPEEEGPCLSIYLYKEPPQGRKERKNVVRFKDMLKKAHHQLMDMGFEENDAMVFMRPIIPLLNHDTLWSQLNEGLAVFVSPNTFRYYLLPQKWNESLHLGSRFYVEPLL